MSQIADAVKGILYFVLLMAFSEMIMPNSRYKKYIKMVMGLILIIMTLAPIMAFLGVSGAGSESGYASALAGIRNAEDGTYAPENEAQWTRLLKAAFDEEAMARLRYIFAEENCELVEARIETNADCTVITRIGAVARPKPEGDKAKPFIRVEPVVIGGQAAQDEASAALRAKVAEYYNLPPQNVTIRTQSKDVVNP